MKKLDDETIAKLSPEKKKKYFAQLKRAKRNRTILAAVTAFIVIAAACFALSVTVLFNITKINVKQPGKYYSTEEIISASGLDIGDNIIRTDFENSAERIKMNLPYVFDVKIDKSLSGIVTISVTDGKKSKIVNCVGGYAVTDEKDKVLEIVKSIPKNIQLVEITAKSDVTAKLGKKFEFADKDEEKIYNDLTAALKNAKLTGVNAINISNPNSIYVEVNNRFRLKLGTDTELERKFQEAVKIIETENNIDTEGFAEINLSILKKVYVTPVETLEETTTAAETETTTQPAEAIDATADEESMEDDNTGDEYSDSENSEADEDENSDESEYNSEEDEEYSE